MSGVPENGFCIHINHLKNGFRPGMSAAAALSVRKSCRVVMVNRFFTRFRRKAFFQHETELAAMARLR